MAQRGANPGGAGLGGPDDMMGDWGDEADMPGAGVGGGAQPSMGAGGIPDNLAQLVQNPQFR